MSKDTDNFRKAYATIQMAAELVGDMAGPEGRNTTFSAKDVIELKRLAREIVCAAGGIHSTHDGRPA